MIQVRAPRGEETVRHLSTRYRLYHLLWMGLDLLLPPRCAGCGIKQVRWCAHCQAEVRPPSEPICDVCGCSLEGRAPVCADCRRNPPRFRALRSWARFDGPVRRALHRLKYSRDIGLAEALTPRLSAYAAGTGWEVDLVVPVPLGTKRLRERGYNQAALIARPLSMALRLAYSPGALVRGRETDSQVGLTKAARLENVRGAFEPRGNLEDRTILLVDDVATTGATLSSCADALYAAGARGVFALTVARANHSHGSTDC